MAHCAPRRRERLELFVGDLIEADKTVARGTDHESAAAAPRSEPEHLIATGNAGLPLLLCEPQARDVAVAELDAGGFERGAVNWRISVARMSVGDIQD